MTNLIAVCGLDCAACPAYTATQADDDKLRAQTAAEWTKTFKHEFKAQDINCDGCTPEGRHVGYCGICEIRKCGTGRKLKTCAECADYACAKLTDFLKMVPEAKQTLEARRASKR